MKYAVIDLGTNTFHLMIAEIAEDKRIINLYEEKQAAKIGKGGISQGIITDEAFERGISILQNYSKRIYENHVEKNHIFAVATSAIRNATNGQAFIDEVLQKTGILVEVISGEKEASLIYEGVKQAVEIGDEVALITDIGGGSVEFVICNNQKIFWKQSIEIGGQRLMDKFMPTDPIPLANVKRMYDYLEEQLLSLTNAVHQYMPSLIIGSAGTFDTLTEVYNKIDNSEFNITENTVYELPVEGFYMIFQSLLAMNREERMKVPGMIALRVDMIVVACCLVNFLLKKYNINSIKCSTFALKEGVLAVKVSKVN
jgi:exopolyphosphatase/guanosine-5'-triphosphate,3'-diphosphate pyrophosphatase